MNLFKPIKNIIMRFKIAREIKEYERLDKLYVEMEDSFSRKVIMRQKIMCRELPWKQYKRYQRF